MAMAPREAEIFWTDFLHRLARRGRPTTKGKTDPEYG
jgi:hypothetical protein